MTVTLFSGSYADRVLATAPGNLLLYTPLLELTGSVGANYGGPDPKSDRNVGYVGPSPDAVAGPFGGRAHQWDAISDVVNCHSTSLASLWNWAEFTVLLFCRVRAASVWSDATSRTLIYWRNASFGSRFEMHRHTTNGQLRFDLVVAGAANSRFYTTASPTEWFSIAMSYREADNRYRIYYSAQAFGATPAVAPVQVIEEATVGSNSGTLNSDGTTLGAYSVSAPAGVYDGFLCELSAWNIELDFATQLSPLMVL